MPDPLSSSVFARAASASACVSSTVTRCTSACARVRPPMRRAATRASAAARVRASSGTGAAGSIIATSVCPAVTRSPGRLSMRSTRPDTGADTTNRRRSRVSPSSSTVTRNGAAHDGREDSTSMIVGASAVQTDQRPRESTMPRHDTIDSTTHRLLIDCSLIPSP